MKLIPIYTWNKGVLEFNKRSGRLSKKPWFQGVLLMACVLVAMLLANLPFTHELYHDILETHTSSISTATTASWMFSSRAT